MFNRDRALVLVLLCYLVGFLAFPVRALLVLDESEYVTQALAFAHGRATLPGATPLVTPRHSLVSSYYAPGTSLLQTPLVAVAGWRAAAALSVIALVVASLVTARWLRDNGYDGRFALLIPANFAVLFFGRTAMSDVPSAAITSLSLWLLWRAERREWLTSFMAGACAGLSLLFRETNIVLLAPLYLGAFARRKCVPWAVLMGGLAGIAARLVISRALFGDALFVRAPGYGFSLHSVPINLPQYAVILLLMFPLGAVLPFFYRGPRRAEAVTAVAVYVMLFLLYEYNSARENGPVKGLVLSARFMIPALPLLTLMAADVFRRWAAHTGATRAWARRLGAVALGCLMVTAFAIHAAVHMQERAQVDLVRAFYEHTTPDVPLVTNHNATLKYLSPVYGIRTIISRSKTSADDVPRLVTQYGRLNIVFLDRMDSEMFREDAQRNDNFLASLSPRCAILPVYESRQGSSRLRVFGVNRCT